MCSLPLLATGPHARLIPGQDFSKDKAKAGVRGSGTGQIGRKSSIAGIMLRDRTSGGSARCRTVPPKSPEASVNDAAQPPPSTAPVRPSFKVLMGQKALVTGASSGLGRAIAIAFG